MKHPCACGKCHSCWQRAYRRRKRARLEYWAEVRRLEWEQKKLKNVPQST